MSVRRRAAGGKEDVAAADDAPADMEESKLHRSQLKDGLTDADEAPDFVTRNEMYVPWIVLFVSFCTRYYRLAEPPGVVFDEYHFGRFTNQYNAGTYFFDIHPPLGKLVLLFIGWIFNYDHTQCHYNNIQDSYTDGCKYYVLRATAAFFGTLTAPLFYLIVRKWNGTVYAGLLGASLFLFDNLNLIESRLVLIDSQLIFWCAAALYSAQCWWARLNQHTDAVSDWEGRHGTFYSPHREAEERYPGLMSEWERLGWCVLMGITTSCAISIKWTGLATPGMIAVESFFAFFFLKRPVPFWDLLRVLGVAFTLYFTWFAWHFWLLPYTGDGDAFMRIEFQRTLINNTNYDPLAPHPGYLTTFFQLNAEMLSANARIDVRHNWESYWYEWPLNLRGILYYSLDKQHTYTATVYLLGNPAVIWLVGIFVVVCFASTFFYLRYKHEPELELRRYFSTFFTAVGFSLWCYTLNLLPYIMVARSAFIYHYMPALMYGEIMTALMFEQLVGPSRMRSAMKVVLTLILAVWLFYAPWVYAFPLTSEGHARRRWYRRWD